MLANKIKNKTKTPVLPARSVGTEYLPRSPEALVSIHSTIEGEKRKDWGGRELPYHG